MVTDLGRRIGDSGSGWGLGLGFLVCYWAFEVFGSVHSRVVRQGFDRAGGAASVDSRQKASRSVLIATIAGFPYLKGFRFRI